MELLTIVKYLLFPLSFIAGGTLCSLLYSRWLKKRDLISYDLLLLGRGTVGWTGFGRFLKKIDQMKRIERFFSTVITLFLDILRSAGPILIGKFWFDMNPIELGIMAILIILGNSYSWMLWFDKTANQRGITGGKGVTVALPIITTLDYVTGISILLIWFFIKYMWKNTGLASIMASVSAGVILGTSFIFRGEINGWSALSGIIISVLVIWRHKENLMRIAESLKNMSIQDQQTVIVQES